MLRNVYLSRFSSARTLKSKRTRHVLHGFRLWEATLGMGSQYWQFHAGRFVVGDLELRQIRRPDCRRCWPFELQKPVACEM